MAYARLPDTHHGISKYHDEGDDKPVRAGEYTTFVALALNKRDYRKTGETFLGKKVLALAEHHVSTWKLTPTAKERVILRCLLVLCCSFMSPSLLTLLQLHTSQDSREGRQEHRKVQERIRRQYSGPNESSVVCHRSFASLSVCWYTPVSDQKCIHARVHHEGERKAHPGP